MWAVEKVDLDYKVKCLAQSDQAEVSISLEKGERVRSLDFKADGEWKREDAQRGLMRLDQASTKDFIEITENLMGRHSKVLESRLLR